MESFIVRIYRYEKEESRSVVGTVERAGADSKQSFRRADELWEFLLAAGSSEPPEGGGRARKAQ